MHLWTSEFCAVSRSLSFLISTQGYRQTNEQSRNRGPARQTCCHLRRDIEAVFRIEQDDARGQQKAPGQHQRRNSGEERGPHRARAEQEKVLE